MRAITCGVVVSLVLAVGTMAGAQDVATSFSELRLLTKAGDTVTVTDTRGREVKGRIAVLSPEQLVVTDRAGRHEWAEADVVGIRQRRPDSLLNGALIGMGVGAGIVLAAAVADDVSGPDTDWYVLGAFIYGGIGAAIGVGFDALSKDELDVFRREPPRAQVRLQPMLAPSGGGLRLAVVF